MLRHLKVQNFATVEQLELDLEGGLTVFTGETGAGKSLLVGALGLVLGDRADSSTVRGERSLVTALFDIARLPELKRLLTEKGVEDSEEDQCILRRQVEADGRSRAFVNGTPVPAQTLRKIGELLIDIHGQHAHQSLSRRDSQREFLDEFAGHTGLLDTVAETYRRWKTVTDELRGICNASAEQHKAELELLSYQIQELELARFTQEEWVTIEQEHSRLSNLTRLVEGGQCALDLLQAEAGSVEFALHRACRELHSLQEFDHRIEPVVALLDEAAIQISEAGQALRHYLGSLDPDPGRQKQLEARIAALHDLARKHRIRVEDLPAHQQTLKARLAALEHSRERLQELQEAQRTSLAHYREAAWGLHESRLRAAQELAQRIAVDLSELGLPNSAFSILIEPAAGASPTATGMDRVEYLVSTNPGLPLRPLSKVASGGELSRISLAIQVITASDKGIPTLVFDEVDVGIGGAVAETVGQHLRHLAQGGRQVLCVTHLPQVASLGHQHLQVIKTIRPSSTSTRIQCLKGAERIKEIARMLGGRTISPQTLNHAKEMLEQWVRS